MKIRSDRIKVLHYASQLAERLQDSDERIECIDELEEHGQCWLRVTYHESENDDETTLYSVVECGEEGSPDLWFELEEV